MLKALNTTVLVLGFAFGWVLTASCGEELDPEAEKLKNLKKVPVAARNNRNRYGITISGPGQLTAKCSTVLVMKVTSGSELADDERRPAELGGQQQNWMLRAAGLKVQRVTCEVTDVVRGKAKAGSSITILARHFDTNAVAQGIRAAGIKARPDADTYQKLACFKKDEVYLVFLAVDEVATGTGKEPVYSTAGPPNYGPEKQVLAGVKKMAKAIRSYNSPGELKKDDQLKAAAAVKALASGNHVEREKAHKALAAMGAVIRGLLEKEASDNSDLEVRLRSARILNEIKPIPYASAKSWAGDYVFKIPPPEEKPEGEDKEGNPVPMLLKAAG